MRVIWRVLWVCKWHVTTTRLPNVWGGYQPNGKRRFGPLKPSFIGLRPLLLSAPLLRRPFLSSLSMKGPFLWLRTGPLAHVWAGSMSRAWSRTLTVSLTSPTPHEKVFPSSFMPTETTRKHGENASTDGQLRAGLVWCSRTRRMKQFQGCTTREGLPTATERHVSFLGWTSLLKKYAGQGSPPTGSVRGREPPTRNENWRNYRGWSGCCVASMRAGMSAAWKTDEHRW